MPKAGYAARPDEQSGRPEKRRPDQVSHLRSRYLTATAISQFTGPDTVILYSAARRSPVPEPGSSVRI